MLMNCVIIVRLMPGVIPYVSIVSFYFLKDVKNNWRTLGVNLKPLILYLKQAFCKLFLGEYIDEFIF